MTADADQLRPSIPTAENDAEVREALRGAGVDLTGASRDGGGNSRVARPWINASELAEEVAATGISDDPIPTAVPRGPGEVQGYKSADASVAERFREWQARRANADDQRQQIRKAEDTLVALRGDVDRQRAKAARKRAKAEAIAKSPALREAHAHRKGIKAAQKHLSRGLDNTTSLALGYSTYKSRGGKLSLEAWKRSILAADQK